MGGNEGLKTYRLIIILSDNPFALATVTKSSSEDCIVRFLVMYAHDPKIEKIQVNKGSAM